MRLSALGSNALLEGLLNADFSEIVRYHTKTMRRRRLVTMLLQLCIVLLFLISAVGVIYLWDSFVIDSDNRIVKFFADAVGLPLILLFFAHAKAIRRVRRRGLFAGPIWQLPAYWFNCAIGLANQKRAKKS
jgi:hypothetical protein